MSIRVEDILDTKIALEILGYSRRLVSLERRPRGSGGGNVTSVNGMRGEVVITSGGTPGGSDTQVQYNNSGAFGGSSGITLSATQITANNFASNIVLAADATYALGTTTVAATNLFSAALTAGGAGTNVNLAINGKGSGTVTIAGTSTGGVTVGTNLTIGAAGSAHTFTFNNTNNRPISFDDNGNLNMNTSGTIAMGASTPIDWGGGAFQMTSGNITHRGFTISMNQDLSSGDAVTITSAANIELTASSGTQNWLNIAPKINQSGTAGYTGLLVNSTETATGSGLKRPIDVQIGGTSYLFLSNNGIVGMRNHLNFPTNQSYASVIGGQIFHTAAHGLVMSGGSGTSLGYCAWYDSGGTVQLVMTNANVLKLTGTAVRATTEGTNHFDIFDGTAPVGTLANGISLYSTSGELRVMDSAGNATLLSPHAKDGSWIYDSVSPVTGKHLRVDMERMVKFLNKHFGQDWVKEVEAV